MGAACRRQKKYVSECMWTAVMLASRSEVFCEFRNVQISSGPPWTGSDQHRTMSRQPACQFWALTWLLSSCTDSPSELVGQVRTRYGFIFLIATCVQPEC